MNGKIQLLLLNFLKNICTWAYRYIENSRDKNQSKGKSHGRKITFSLLDFNFDLK